MRRIGFFSRILDLLAPRCCPVCGSRLSVSEDLLCGPCNLHLPRTDFAQSPADNELARLFWGRIPIERAASLFRFESQSQVARLIYDLKYHQHPEYGELMGQFVAKEFDGTGFFEGIDAIFPIPLARNRQRQRGYNQSMEIARGIHEATGIPICGRAVRRRTFKESQTRKDWWERQENVEGVFRLVSPEMVSGKHLLIVDDVVTTGATIVACARELLRAKSVRLSVLTLGYAKS